MQSELDLQRSVSQSFNQNTQQISTQINANVKEHFDKAKELEKQASDAANNGERQLAHQLAAQAAEEYKTAENWQLAGVGVNMVAAGLSAPTDSAGGIAAATLSPAASYKIGQDFKKLAQANADGKLTGEQQAAHVLAHTVLGAAVAAAGGNDPLAGGISAGGAEYLAPKVSQFLYGTDDPEKLTAEQKDTVANIMSLAGAGVGVAVGGSGTNTVQGGLNAEGAVENNWGEVLIGSKNPDGLEPMNADEAKANMQRAIDDYARRLFNGDKSKAKIYIHAYNSYRGRANSDAVKKITSDTLNTILHPVDSTKSTVVSLYHAVSNPRKTYNSIIMSYQEWDAIYQNALKHDVELAAKMQATRDATIGANGTFFILSGGISSSLTRSPAVLNIKGNIGNLWNKATNGVIKRTQQPITSAKSTTKKIDYCFVAGTLVQTAEGLKPIEQIQRGDLVWSRQEFGDAYAYKPVFETKRTENQQIYEVIVKDASGKTESYFTTAEHPFHVAELGWLKAELLLPGMALINKDGDSGSLKVLSQTKLTRWETVYNFEVEEFGTYHVGEFGVWVHNNCIENISSSVKKDPFLLREARSLTQQESQGINQLLEQLRKGNTNPGIGTSKYGNITEFRHRNGGRIYAKKTDLGWEILAYSGKGNQNKVWKRLKELYQ